MDHRRYDDWKTNVYAPATPKERREFVTSSGFDVDGGRAPARGEGEVAGLHLSGSGAPFEGEGGSVTGVSTIGPDSGRRAARRATNG